MAVVSMRVTPDPSWLLEQAMRGGLRAVDAVECTVLTHALARGDLVLRSQNGEPALPGGLRVTADSVIHGYAPGVPLAVVWEAGAVCDFCAGHGEVCVVGRNDRELPVACPQCGGCGVDAPVDVCLVTTPEGVVLENRGEEIPRDMFERIVRTAG